MYISRYIARKGSKLFFSLMTRLTVEGLEHVPRNGAFLVLPNHLSNIDGPMMLGITPRELEFIGPGDFKVKPRIKHIAMKMYRPVLVNRGHTDSKSMREITKMIRSGRPLLMFPAGGMWEKRGLHYKNGATYFSLLAQVPIIPVGISGAYMHTTAAFVFGFPKITVRFGKPIGPVPKPEHHNQQQEILDHYTREVEKAIFSLLNKEDQDRYIHWEQMEYRLHLEIKNSGSETLVDLHTPILAEFIQKPNLFRPMYQSTGRKIPFFRRKRRFSRLSKALRDCEDLLDILQNPPFNRYVPYRMGEEAQPAVIQELEQLRKRLSELQGRHKQVRLVQRSRVPGMENSVW